MLQRFSGTIFGFFNFILLARNLPPVQLGIWSLFLIIVTTLELSKSSLLKNAHIRFINSSNQSNSEAIAWTSLFINLTSTFIFSVLIFFLSGYLSKWLNTENDLSVLLLYYIPGLFCMVFYSHYEAVQLSFLNFKGVFIGSLIKQSIFFSFLFYLHLTNGSFDLKSIVVYFTIANFIATAFMFMYSYKILSFKIRYSFAWFKKFINYGGYILGSGILSNISANIDQFLTSKYLNPFYVSYYSTTSRIVGVVDIPMNAVAQVLFPKMSNVSQNESVDKVNYYLEKSIGFLFAIMTPVILLFIIFSKYILLIIAGEQYLDATFILQIYLARSLIMIFQQQSSSTLVSMGKSKIQFMMGFISIFSKTVLVYIAIQFLGIRGAAFGSIILSFCNMIAWYFILKKETGLSVRRIFEFSLTFYKIMFNKIQTSLFFK